MIREIKVGNHYIGGNHPILVQSMAATKTSDREATLKQVQLLHEHGAKIVRIAIDKKSEVEDLQWIRERTDACLSCDLQENYLLVKDVAPLVDKIRYNPGHLHHLKPKLSIEEKVSFIVEEAKKNDCAIRIGVNCGSIAPLFVNKYSSKDEALIESALFHCQLLDSLNFVNYCVSIKDSDPTKVILLNRLFHKKRPEIPLHIGVTEAGILPHGLVKTRQALENLIPDNIGSTVRMSLTLPFEEKFQEIILAEQTLSDIAKGKFWHKAYNNDGYNVISCPSCSRVENNAFVNLAQEVNKLTDSLPKEKPISIAVMGCRVNGPGETDEADLGLWCGPKVVNLKKKTQVLGAFSYDEILPKLASEIQKILEEK